MEEENGKIKVFAIGICNYFCDILFGYLRREQEFQISGIPAE
jgi:hypothetical protein